MPTAKNHQLLDIVSHIRMEIFEISHGYLDQSWHYGDLKAAFTRIYLPLSGMGRISYGGKTVDLVPGYLYVIPSGLSFSCECPEALEKIYLHLVLTQPDGRDLLCGVSDCLVLEDTNRIAQKLIALESPHGVGSALALNRLIYEVLERALALSPIRHAPLPEYSPATKNALAYIDAHLSATLSVGEIANALFLSPAILQKRFREDVGKPVGQFIDSQLMAKAELLLLANTLSVKEISEKLGFCDQFYFSRRFSAFHHATPSQFRKMYQA